MCARVFAMRWGHHHIRTDSLIQAVSGGVSARFAADWETAGLVDVTGGYMGAALAFATANACYSMYVCTVVRGVEQGRTRPTSWRK